MAARLLMISAALLLAAGCTSQGAFPSLAERSVERAYSGRAAPPCATGEGETALPVRAASAAPAVDDPQLRARIEALLEAVRAGQASFAAAQPAAARGAARAGAAGSETWLEAQQELSRLEAARGRTVDALAELDRLAAARTADASAGDAAAMAAGLEEARRVADAQQAELTRLQARINRP